MSATPDPALRLRLTVDALDGPEAIVQAATAATAAVAQAGAANDANQAQNRAFLEGLGTRARSPPSRGTRRSCSAGPVVA
jgi:hypothetical protein